MTTLGRGTGVGKGPARAATPSLARMAMLLVGLVILVLALPPFFDFPWLRYWTLPLAAIYLFLLLILPRLWLVVLPLATVGLDITPFTGRFSYNELDLVFLVTLASGLLYGRYRYSVFRPRVATAVLLAYVVVVALVFSGWRYFVLPPGIGFENPYYTDEYGYKVIKGMIWGIALVPMWGHLLAVDKAKSINTLVGGLSAAALLLGLIVLWERGTLGVILDGSAWYHWVNSLLDLSSSYRVTGIFSAMHTGGEAFDGVVLLLLPGTLYAATNGRTVWLRVVGALGFMALAYVTLVGFTRSTYAAFTIAVILYAFLALQVRRVNGITLLIPLKEAAIALGVGLLAAVVVYRYAGSYGLASYGALIALAYGVRRFQLPARFEHAATVLAGIIIIIAVSAHGDSRWVEASFGGALLIVLTLLGSYVCAVRLFAKSVDVPEIDRLFLLAGLLMLPIVVAFALGGYQINDRVSRVAGDLDVRESHWKNVISSSGDGIWRGLFGNGVGSFPRSYIGRHPEFVKEVGSYYIAREHNRDVLRLGGGRDLTLGQRVPIEPYTNYTINVHLLAAQPARLVVRLCERNLIFASNFTSQCEVGSLRFEATDNAYEKFSVEINSGNVGEGGSLRRWPTVMTLNYDKLDTVVQIDAIDLSADGFNILRNSSFKRGLDYWFPYNDFSHLPWHVKNLYLQVWYESGWLGLGLFLALLGLLVLQNLQRHAVDSLLPAYTMGVLAVCVFGMFGSPLDSARVSWLFYFFLAAGLADFRVKVRSRKTAQSVSAA